VKCVAALERLFGHSPKKEIGIVAGARHLDADRSKHNALNS
jgi:hypothetical protein